METREERGDDPGRQAVEEDGGTLSVPRGGPIYIPNLVGPLTSVADFESSLLLQLQNLEAVLASSDSSPLCGEDLSVDELKVFTEEELVDMAMKEAFQGEENNENPSRASEEHYAIVGKEADISGSTTKQVCSESFSGGENFSSSFETINGSSLVTRSIKNDNSKKRKERQANNHSYELVSAQSSYTAKVEDLVNIKQKQDADKAVARLHSFNGSCKLNESAVTLSEKTERMKSLRFTSAVTKVRSSSVVEHIAVQCPEVVLSVEVYHSLRKWVKTQEFLVLGRQTLAELRDKIYCLTDQMMQKAGQHDPSGYFLIEDVFCNDLRDPSAIDYSEPIFDWLRNSRDEALKKWESIITGELQQKQKAIVGDVTGLQLPRFKAVEMHMIRFCDLRFRLGAGYLYCHQGDCKHTIVIRDMRLIHPEDVHNRADYPIVLFQLKFRVQKCDVCKIYRATKVTVDDKWAQKNPCYFCKDCYFLLHYDRSVTVDSRRYCAITRAFLQAIYLLLAKMTRSRRKRVDRIDNLTVSHGRKTKTTG